MRVLLIILLSLVSAAAFANLPHDIHKIRQKAQNGDPEAQLHMGHLAELNNHYKKAYKWFKKLTDSNKPRYKGGGYNTIGLFYKHGYAVPKNNKKALEYFKKAIELGFYGAYNNLGLAYQHGELGVNQNLKKAKRYFKIAANHGGKPSKFNLANLYAHKNQYKKAFHWYHQAAKQYYLSGMLQTGLVYSLGKGVSKNKAQACKWLRLTLKVYPDYETGQEMLTSVENELGYLQQRACDKAYHKYLKHHDVPHKSDFKARLELKS